MNFECAREHARHWGLITKDDNKARKYYPGSVSSSYPPLGKGVGGGMRVIMNKHKGKVYKPAPGVSHM